MLQNLQNKFNASNDFEKHAIHFSLYANQPCEPPLVKNVDVDEDKYPGKEQSQYI